MKFNNTMVAIVAAFGLGSAAASTSGVVISQVYGGGGNSGATLKNDFVELLNAGSAPVSLAGWSVQYASSTGSSWQVTPLTAVLLQPGQYYLVQQAQGSGGMQDLPTADATGTIAMSGSSGKVALVSTASALSGAQPVSAALVDVVGYGSADFFEGSAAAPGLSNTTAALRAATGCTDTDSNIADFTSGAPAPRNAAAAPSTCSVVGPQVLTIPQIQGAGTTSAFVNQLVQTSGVVTRVNNNGYYIQDATGDGDPATADGLFVFTGSAPSVVAGQLVQLDGTVSEFNTGAATNPDTSARPVTQLIGSSNLQVLGSGFSVTPTVVAFPEAVNDELERVEGMLVRIEGPLTVSQNFFVGRYGQLTLSAGGRLETPTNRHRPGTPEALALADANARARILLDDGSTLQNPNPTPYFGSDDTVRAGDTVASLTGVIDYGLATNSSAGLGDYKLQPTEPVSITRSNPRTTAPDGVGGNLKVASFNVLNYFTTFVDGTTVDGQTGQGCALGGTVLASNCRGANNAAEFARQRAKIIEALAAINADAVGLIEIQNNGSVAAQDLVDGLNARLGAKAYAVVADPASGMGDDAIKVAMIYKPARLSPDGAAFSDTDPVNNRPTLAQTFAAPNGERLTLVVNHFKSKSCTDATGADADQGDGQGCFNDTRRRQAQRLSAWLPTVPGAAADKLVLGDLNAYGQEDPIADLASTGYTDQIGKFFNFGYSYVFDGAAGRLDHALASPSLDTKVTRALAWHINADEPSVIDYNTEFKQPLCATCGPDYYSATAYRSSDHDAVVVGLSVYRFINGNDFRNVLQGTPGDDWFTAGGRDDAITTGAGADVVAVNSLADARDAVRDFTPGQDRIDLRNLLTSIGYTGTDPVADGVLRVRDASRGTTRGAVIEVDADGSAGGQPFAIVVALENVASGDVVVARDLILSTAALRAGSFKPAAVKRVGVRSGVRGGSGRVR